MPRLRLLVAEDSLTVRKHLVSCLAADPELEVVGEAATGKQAVDLCRELRPDAITLDMVMPEMSGLEATELIMAYWPTPILIVSSSTNRGEVFDTYAAMAAGAVDVFEKPTGTESSDDWENRFRAAVKLVAKIKVITHPRARLARKSPTSLTAPGPPIDPSFHGKALRPVAIAMAASTGGPAAVQQILATLPASFPLPILTVIHIGQLFEQSFAEWLGMHSSLPVSYATDGQTIPPIGTGRVLLAPCDLHLVLAAGRLRLVKDAPRHSCRPSADVLFESVATDLGPLAIGCLLTGMGCDGAAGLTRMRRAGAFTIAQDEATSTVFGMPREAIRLGGAASVLPLPEIAPTLLSLAGER